MNGLRETSELFENTRVGWALTYDCKQILLALREGFEICLRPDCKSSYSKLPPSFHV